MHFHTGWFDHSSYDQTTTIRIYKQIRKLHLQLHLKGLNLKYMLKVEKITKSS